MTELQKLKTQAIKCKNEAALWLCSLQLCNKMIAKLKEEHQSIRDQISILQLQDMVNNDQTNNV